MTLTLSLSLSLALTLDLALFGFAGTVDSRLEDPDPAQPDFDAS